MDPRLRGDDEGMVWPPDSLDFDHNKVGRPGGVSGVPRHSPFFVIASKAKQSRASVAAPALDCFACGTQ